jgi:putative RNA 2'-phosphotransferase
MAGILRHFPEKFDLDMDLNGWVDIREMVEALRDRDRRMHWLRPHHIRAVSETCTKGRYDVRGDMVRATYAHTVEIELDLPTDDIPELLYFPCSAEESIVLIEHGIKPGDRKHVHLSKTITAAANAGYIHNNRPRIVEVDCIQMEANGDTIYHAGTTVYLTEEVEARYCSLVDEDHPELAECLDRWITEEEAAAEEE